MLRRSAKIERRDQPPLPIALAGSDYMPTAAFASMNEAPGYSYLDRAVQESPRTVHSLRNDEYTDSSFTRSEDSVWVPGPYNPCRMDDERPRRSREYSEPKDISTTRQRLRTIATASSLANYKDALLDEDQGIAARGSHDPHRAISYDPIPTRLPRSRPSPVRAGLEKAGLETSYKLVRKDATKRKELSFRYKATRQRPPTPRPGATIPSRNENSPPVKEKKDNSSRLTPFEPFDFSRLAACVPVEDAFSAPKPPIVPKPRKRTKSLSDGTKVELIKLKRELRSLKRMGTSRSGSVHSGSSSGRSKRVRFAKPLVTLVTQRPYTDPDDVEKLYFVPEELDELEWDRETTEWDQIECVAEQNSPDSSADIAVSVSFQYAAEEDTSVASDHLSASPVDESAV